MLGCPAAIPFLLTVLVVAANSSRFQVRVLQSSVDRQKIKDRPVQFWELVEWRPIDTEDETTTPATTTSTTTVTTTTTTTTTEAPTTTTTIPPTTVAWEPPTTVPLCDASDPEILVKRMRDSGVYNDIYMAPDFFTASRTFPNLAGRHFMRPKNKYACDEHCRRSSRLVRIVMTGDEHPGLPDDPPRTWWDQSKWDGEETRRRRLRRSIREADSSGDRRKELEQTIKTALKELEEIEEEPEMRREDEEMEGEKVDGEDQGAYSSFFENPLSSHLRTSRSIDPRDLVSKNSGITRDVLGTTIALECQEKQDNGVSKTGYHFCSTCRAVRHLPKSYFPRILNEVICGDSACVKGDGRCAQRFLPFKVLHNEGSESCPKWKVVSIDIRTCCDCVVHPLSPFVRYLQTP